ncbi:MAG: carboxymethylenebutenolidase [Candidatus Methylumidiphilus alinenensis]|uniref:Carboxymethylenebutenolidase n=1 Tax=Candidatus Methylumidiphilus alinenensis TaxID=2202197 RepID=A0A2W4SAA2_9GAMM|nr:MAG: carboxymethylenebutenolidase [Candidatus Methylumidiphilus alinenensis]
MTAITVNEHAKAEAQANGRRDFLTTLLATGFALAVRPVRSETLISTDTEGLEAGAVLIPVADGSLPAYRAKPKGSGPFPTLLVVQEIFGVHEHIKDITRRLAKLGYLAIAPELYFRQGDVSTLASIDDIREKVISKVADKQVLADLDACLAWVASNGGDADRLGITGFCWGGRIVWLYAAHQAKLKAGVAWYGRVKGPTNELNPRQPVDLAAELKAPVLGLYGGKDQGIPVESVEELRSAIQAAGGNAEIHIYPEAPHAFFADYRPSYRQEVAEDGWRRLQSWFKRFGV